MTTSSFVASFRVSLMATTFVLSLTSAGCSQQKPAPVSTETASLPLWGEVRNGRPDCVKGIHLTSWVTGNKKRRVEFEALLAETELNTVVIDIKEIEGTVFVPGVKLDGSIDTYEQAMTDMAAYLKFLKERGVFTIARIVVFKDQLLAKKKPDWAVRASTPIPKAAQLGLRKDVWVDRNGKAWADPFNPHVWDYNIDIAERCVKLGFQGIQFDYIRFPSDGNTKVCVYSKPHNTESAPAALAEFLARAKERLKPYHAELSIDVFGLVGSFAHDMGIGQRLKDLTKSVDVISPMMYPSHYAPGEYRLISPDASPYATVRRSVADTNKVLRNTGVVHRPYLQDFSLKTKYTARHVRDQIEAALDQGVGEWLLWNPSCRYTRDALMPFAEKLYQPAPADSSK